MHNRKMCSYLNLQRITSSSSQIISELEKSPVIVNSLGLVLRNQDALFSSTQIVIINFSSNQQRVTKSLGQQESRWYHGLTSKLLMKPRLKVTGCNLQLNNQLEHWDSHKGWLHKRQSPLPKGLFRMRSSLWGACKVLWEDNFSVA